MLATKVFTTQGVLCCHIRKRETRVCRVNLRKIDGLNSSKYGTTNLEPGLYRVCDELVVGQPSTGLKSAFRAIL